MGTSKSGANTLGGDMVSLFDAIMFELEYLFRSCFSC